MINGFDAISGAAFGGGGGSRSRGSRGRAARARRAAAARTRARARAAAAAAYAARARAAAAARVRVAQAARARAKAAAAARLQAASAARAKAAAAARVQAAQTARAKAKAAAAARLQAASAARAKAAAQARVQAAQAARVRAREASAAAAKIQAAAAKKAAAAPISSTIPLTAATAGASFSQPVFSGNVMLAGHYEAAERAATNLALESISEQGGSGGAAARVVKKANSGIGIVSSISSKQPLSGVDNMALAFVTTRVAGPKTAIAADAIYSGSGVDKVVDDVVHATAGKGLVETTEFMLEGAKALPFNQGGNSDDIRSMIGSSWR